MKEICDGICFERHQMFKSKILDLLVTAINDTARLVFLFIILDFIFGSFSIELKIFSIENVWDIIQPFIVLLFLNFLFKETHRTKVDLQNKIIKIRGFGFLLFTVKIDVMQIDRIIINSNNNSLFNVEIVCGGEKKRASIKDTEKFAQLLLGLNPSIKVEYKT